MGGSEGAGQPVVQIRAVEAVDEYRACQALQRRAWGIVEDGYVVPVATMISVQHAGGLVLGAFIGGHGEADERLAGFAFAYLGRVRGRWALYSQLAAVDDTYRALGIGGRLKQAQRAWAREQGLALVAWTFDPLQAGNANFNLRRLGAFCRTYQAAYFGERSDALNAGLDSDRLLAEWPVQDAPRAWQPESEPPRVEIPADLDALRRMQPAEARAWQRRAGSALAQHFANGYVAMDVEREGEGAARRVFYVLRRPVDAASLIP